MTTVAEAVREAAARLSQAGIGTPARDARRLIADVLSVDMGGLTVRLSDRFPDSMAATYGDMVARRANREPVSHILGYRDFWKSRFRVTPDVLDPRPETETLIELALGEPFQRVLDIGTGSGAILVSLLLERPESLGVGTDVSHKAVLVAGENAEQLGVSERIILPLSHWFEDIGGRYDLIVSNPPYIATDEIAGLEPEVRDYEPIEALTDGANGLTGYREIAKYGPRLLRADGRILVEIGPTQGRSVSDIFAESGLVDVIVHPDMDGRDRVVSARKPN